MLRTFYCVIRNSLISGCLILALTATASASEQKILVLGDSISAAYGMSLDQGWVAQLGSDLQAEYPQFGVVNASISGETTAGGLRRLPALLKAHNPSVVIIELGANDGLRGYPLLTLRNNLTALVTMAQASGARVILFPMEIPPNYGARYTSGFRESFRDVAQETDSVLAPFLLEGVAGNPTMIQADGLHPTIEAQPIILSNVLASVSGVLAQL
jgi:acyl-CoA thioesterase-1|tara:strand:- start:68923 stop:69564 length:642 start_codon:yes stop_codon:yes gene_type:complete